MQQLTKATYNEVVKNNETVLIDFYADWCGPCKMIAPIVEEIAKEHPEICVCKVNVDNEQALAIDFKVMYIPTIAVIKNGEIVHKSSGLKTKPQLLELLGLN